MAFPLALVRDGVSQTTPQTIPDWVFLVLNGGGLTLLYWFFKNQMDVLKQKQVAAIDERTKRVDAEAAEDTAIAQALLPLIDQNKSTLELLSKYAVISENQVKLMDAMRQQNVDDQTKRRDERNAAHADTVQRLENIRDTVTRNDQTLSSVQQQLRDVLQQLGEMRTNNNEEREAIDKIKNNVEKISTTVEAIAHQVQGITQANAPISETKDNAE